MGAKSLQHFARKSRSVEGSHDIFDAASSIRRLFVSKSRCIPLTMELLEGQNLREIVAGKALKTDELLNLAIRSRDPLDAAQIQ